MNDNKKYIMYLENLPRWNGEGCGNKGSINWKKSEGMDVKFEYNKTKELVKGKIQIIEYRGNDNLIVKYKDNAPVLIKTYNLKKGKIGAIIGKITSKFKIEIDTVFKDNRRNLIVIDRKIVIRKEGEYKINRKYYNVKCNKCGYKDHWVEESSLINGTNCKCCEGKIVVPGINDIPTTAPWMIDYFQGGLEEAQKYTKCSNDKIIPKCKYCGTLKQNSIRINDIYRKKSIGCKCSDGISYPNKFMINMLSQLREDFDSEVSPSWCKFPNYIDKDKIYSGRYDFILHSKKLIVEMNGGLGHGERIHPNKKMTKEESLYIDNQKKICAQKNGYKFIKIDCIYNSIDKRYELIKNNIQISELKKHLALDLVKFEECDKFAQKNICIEACKLKKGNNNITSSEIGTKLGISQSVVVKYLKIGNRLELCKYDPKKEIINNGYRCSRNKKLHVRVLLNGVKVEEFKSLTMLERESEEKLGCKLYSSTVSRRLKMNPSKAYNGYTFEIVN